MVVGAKVCELTDGFLCFVCGNFDVSPYSMEPYFVCLDFPTWLLATCPQGLTALRCGRKYCN